MKYFVRFLIGPALIVDGVIMTLCLGYIRTKFALAVSKRFAKVNYQSMKELQNDC